MKTKIQEMTARNKPVSMAERIKRLNAYLGGWMNYLALVERPASSGT